MKYQDGTEIRIGDRIRLGNGEEGVVVFSIDTDEYTAEFPQSEWSYLEKGIMVRTDDGALIHFEQSNTDVIALVGHGEQRGS